MGAEGFGMLIGTDSLALSALAIVVAFGVTFLLWTLAHLFRESHPPSGSRTQLFIPRPRRH